MARPHPTRISETELELDAASAPFSHIPNSQDATQVTALEVQNCRERYRREHPTLEERTRTGSHIYNCHGLVFASRRTRITDAGTVRAILGYDSYHQVNAKDALPGDIAIYIKYPEGEIDHSAVVIESAKPQDVIPSPRVFSKWGFWLEVIHLAQACPYALEPGVAIEYFRCKL